MYGHHFTYFLGLLDLLIFLGGGVWFVNIGIVVPNLLYEKVITTGSLSLVLLVLLVYTLARLILIVGLFRSLFFLPHSALISTWASKCQLVYRVTTF